MYNKVILVGNLTRDVELRYAPNGTAIAKFGLATNRTYIDQTGQKVQESMFIDITVFGRSAEVAAQYLTKGRRVLVDGRLVFDQWVDATTGQKRSKHSVVAEKVQFMDSANNGANAGVGAGAANAGMANANAGVGAGAANAGMANANAGVGAGAANAGMANANAGVGAGAANAGMANANAGVGAGAANAGMANANAGVGAGAANAGMANANAGVGAGANIPNIDINEDDIPF